MRTSMLLLCSLLMASPGLVHGAVTWRAVPEVVTEQAHGGGHRRGGPLAFYLREGEGAEAALWTPDLGSKSLGVSRGQALVKPTGVEGYHLLLARHSAPGEEQVALRYFYLPGKPSGHSPSELLQTQVSQLEIVPTPLPREHWRYQTSAPARFTVRFENRPLVGTPVRLLTTNGTFMEGVTDAQGQVDFTLPEDFARVASGRQGNAPAEFMVSTAHTTSERTFNTTLSADYHANPSHWQSRLGGGLALAAGFACGLVLLRRIPGEGRSA